jgi:TATA-box binding protein (TBP) (component of TFIID and TFIIIB)
MLSTSTPVVAAPAPIQLKPTPLRVSTHVITTSFGAKLNLDSVYEQLPQRLIPVWYPGEGILKMEHNQTVLGACHRDCFTQRSISEKTFYNQSTIVIRREYKPGEWKESNIKLFANGSIQMTGVPSAQFAKDTLTWLMNELLDFPKNPFEGTPVLQEMAIKLINTDYSINALIKRNSLFQILTRNYNIFSLNENTIYQGVNAKYFYNKKADPAKPGICSCPKSCRGQGTGDGPGQCKRVTLCIFQDGKIIVTGARTMDQIEEAYHFLNGVLQKHADEVLRPMPKAAIKA